MCGRYVAPSTPEQLAEAPQQGPDRIRSVEAGQESLQLRL